MSLSDPQLVATGRLSALAAPRSRFRVLRGGLLRDPLSVVSLLVLSLIILACAAAPLYAEHVAHTTPFENHAGDKIRSNGKLVDVVSSGRIESVDGQLNLTTGGVPVGPQGLAAHGKFVLGADANGRDVAVRLLYGGRTSLLIGFGSAVFCIGAGLALALVAGYHGGWIGTLIGWLFDLIWAFPVLLLGSALGATLQIQGFHHGPIDISGGSLWIPVIVISIVVIPYAGRVLRAEVMSLRRREFIDAAITEGASSWRVMRSELLPNVRGTALALFPVIVANNMIMEAGLSFLGAGVKDPQPSWGKMIADGSELLTSAPTLAVAPGLALFLTVLSLNFLGEGLRVALAPRGRGGGT